MSYEARVPCGRGLLRPVLRAVEPVRLPLWDAAANEWVLTYSAAWLAVAALRVAAYERGRDG